MDKTEVKIKTISGIIWQLAQRFANKIVGFIVSIILARLLLPEDFGLVAMTSIFLTIASVFVDSGLGTALVQQKDIDKDDINTVFIFGLCLSTILYLILFHCAPFIAALYKDTRLISILRLLGLNLIPSSLCSVQGAIISRSLNFRKFFLISLTSSIISAIVGLFMAFLDFGLYALVGQSLTQTLCATLLYCKIVKWRPSCRFSIIKLKQLYSYGINLLAANLIGTFFNELRGFLIGVKYKPDDLAYYNRGDSIPGFINSTVTGSLVGVMLPAISRVQDSEMIVRQYLRRSMQISTFILAPILFILISSSKDIIILLYTEKWIRAVPFMQVACINYVFTILSSANLQAINAIGRSDVTLKLELLKKPIYLLILLFSIRISPLALAIGTALYAFYAGLINSYPNKKLIKYSYREQLKDTLPQVLIAILSGGIAFMVGFLPIHPILRIILQWSTGLITYLCLALALKLESCFYFKALLTEYLSNQFNLVLKK